MIEITLVRNATLLVELGGRRLVVDPMLDDEGARPPVENMFTNSWTSRKGSGAAFGRS
jgi:L-ascorbate metabolism protein UlaG (beta-lactamase superfamily)